MSATRHTINANALRAKQCEPCEGGVEPLTADECEALMPGIDDDWSLTDDGRALQREIVFPGYSRTLAFVNAVGWIANVEGHHPLIRFGYGFCEIIWTTNAIHGLSVNDFICAAKTDYLMASLG
ncbi:MAG: 4a-hydroxytetrahydrobiopterin dehydratase [Pseudomonadota bacterium]